MSLPNFICAIAGHDSGHIFSTTDSVFLGDQSATFKDLRAEIQFNHHDANCECGARLTDAWRTNIDRTIYLVDRILTEFDEDELLRTKDTSIDLNALVTDHFPRRDVSEEPATIQLVFDTDDSRPAPFKRVNGKKGEHIVFGNSVLMKEANRHGTPVIPWTSLTDFNQLAMTPGVLFVDKTQPWRRCHEQYRVPIVRRPRGYGKTTLLSMLAALHDVRRTDVTFLEGSDVPECLVLEFDMNHPTLITSSAPDFQSTLNKYVLDTLTNFMQKYKEHLGLTEEQIQDCCHNFPTSGSCIIRVMEIVKESDWLVFLSIDNYNAPILEKNVHALKTRLEEILCIHFYQFVEDYVIRQAEAGLIVGGILPEGLAQTCYHVTRHFGLGRYDGSCDCTESKFAQEMFGLTKAQVRTLDTVVNPNGSPRGPDILKDLKFLRIVPQQYSIDGDWSTEAAMFSMAEVLDVISLRSGMPRQLCFLFLFTVVAVNTEIVNFYASSDQRAARNEWTTLSANGSQKQWEILPAPLGLSLSDNTSQLWINLDLSSKERTAYTLRVSWAAYHPTNVFIDVLDKPARAHIRFFDAGVLTPGRKKQATPVSFNIVLERLYFGFLPASVVPTLAFMSPVLLTAGLAIPWINAYLEKIAVEVRKERRLKSFGVKP